MTSVILFAHGSAVEPANEQVRELASRAAGRAGLAAMPVAFLERAQPALPELAASLIREGARKLVVVPYFLSTGSHLGRDLPALVRQIREAYPDVTVEVTRALGQHPLALEAIADLARQGEGG
ncbi:MAG: CbiX/SirB N-terminal domain-containing protein [Bryobacteraceae bacterium]|nr:CbiX/SirB N-terminal domain-containing protein [Bryobacteraceae bacterium]